MDSVHYKEVHFLPDPVMGLDDHYKPFADVYDTGATEEGHPSLTYYLSEQHAQNAGVVVQCDECDKWCLLFLK